MMAGEFWFSDRQWAVIEPLLPRNQPGARRVDDRRVLSGIVHVLRSGGRWQDCPAVYGPPTTIYNRFHRWSRRGLWQRLLQALAVAEPGGVHLIDSTTTKAHRSAPGAKEGGPGAGDRPLTWRPDDQDPHAVVDGQGRPLAFTLSAGHRHDSPMAPALVRPFPQPGSALPMRPTTATPSGSFCSLAAPCRSSPTARPASAATRSISSLTACAT